MKSVYHQIFQNTICHTRDAMCEQVDDQYGIWSFSADITDQIRMSHYLIWITTLVEISLDKFDIPHHILLRIEFDKHYHSYGSFIVW